MSLQDSGNLIQEMPRTPVASVVEVSAPKGAWFVPSTADVTLAVALSDFSVCWRVSQGMRSEDIQAGTAAICEPGRERTFGMRNTASLALVMLHDDAFEDFPGGAPLTKAGLQAHEVLRDSTLQELTNILVRERRAGFTSGSLFWESVATAVSSYLVRRYSAAPPVKASSRGGMAPVVLRRCLEYIEAHLGGSVPLGRLAHEAGMSRSHFVRSFRQSIGRSPHQYLLHRRVEHARTLMHDPRTPLTEVALASGFANQQHFARIFKRFSTMTPREYRRSL